MGVGGAGVGGFRVPAAGLFLQPDAEFLTRGNQSLLWYLI